MHLVVLPYKLYMTSPQKLKKSWFLCNLTQVFNNHTKLKSDWKKYHKSIIICSEHNLAHKPTFGRQVL